MTRDTLAVRAYDPSFGIEKFSPLADWTEDDVWAYLRARQVPYNRLRGQGLPVDRLRTMHPADGRRRGMCVPDAGGGNSRSRRSAGCTSDPAMGSSAGTRKRPRDWHCRRRPLLVDVCFLAPPRRVILGQDIPRRRRARRPPTCSPSAPRGYLERADIVFHDALVHPDVHRAGRARREVAVGKRCPPPLGSAALHQQAAGRCGGKRTRSSSAEGR